MFGRTRRLPLVLNAPPDLVARLLHAYSKTDAARRTRTAISHLPTIVFEAADVAPPPGPPQSVSVTPLPSVVLKWLLRPVVRQWPLAPRSAMFPIAALVPRRWPVPGTDDLWRVTQRRRNHPWAQVRLVPVEIKLVDGLGKRTTMGTGFEVAARRGRFDRTALQLFAEGFGLAGENNLGHHLTVYASGRTPAHAADNSVTQAHILPLPGGGPVPLRVGVDGVYYRNESPQPQTGVQRDYDPASLYAQPSNSSQGQEANQPPSL